MDTPQPAHAIAQLSRIVRSTLVVALLCSAGIVISATPAFAASITVNTTVDENGSGANCSLREAIQAANTDSAFGGCTAGSGADTIFLAAGATYDLGATPLISSTAFGSSAFAITSTITISGSGATLTRSGTASARFFYVSGAGNLTLFSMTVSNGRQVGGNGGSGAGGGGGAAGLGGAIFNEGTLTIDRSTFTGNTAIGGNGGNGSTNTTGTGGAGGGGLGGDGISVANGSCASPTTGGNGGSPNSGTGGSSPSAGGNGGGGGGGNSDGCSNTVSSVSGAAGGFGGGGGASGSDEQGQNSGNGGNGGFGGGGGGVGAETGTGNPGTAGAGGTFGGNGSSNAGGGNGNGGGGGGGAGLGGVVFNHAGTVTARNSTFSANTVTGGSAGTGGSPTAGSTAGSAIFNRNGSVTLNNATINANSGAGAVYNLSETSAATLTVRNSILANSSGGDDCISSGTSDTVTQSNSIMETDTSCGTPVSSSDPGLAALAGNNGSTQTHAITTSSPAYNAGSNATCETTDQRGVARPQGTTCDIGAYELVLPITGLSFVNSSPTRLTDTTLFTATITGGTGVTYTWNFGDGFVTTTSVTTTSRTYAAAGVYTAILTATNFNGISVTTRPVTITNLAPIANAGADQTVNVNAAVTLNGSASSDPDNHTPLQYLWAQSGGTGVTLNNAGTQSASFTAPGTPAVLTFTLRVTDSQGLADPTPDTIVITVTDVSIAGLTAQNSSPTRLDDTTFFTATTSAGSNVVYTWNFGDGSGTVNGANANHDYASAGNFTAIVTATNGGGSVSKTTPVTITNQTPVADAGGNQSVSVNAGVTLNGSGSSDPDNHTPLAYLWTQTGGASVTLNNAGTQNATFAAPNAPAVLTFTLRVTDSHGLADPTPDIAVITVGDIAVSTVAAQNSSPTRLTDATTFTATANGSNVVFTWNFADGSSTVNGANVNHTYTTAGSYTAIVTATNGNNTLSATTLVTVTNDAPVANAGSDQTVSVNASVSLNGSGSSDPDGHTPLQYRWTQTGGPVVVLNNANAASPSFTAPASPTVLTFTLSVTDAQVLGSVTPDEVVITVNDVSLAGLTAQSSSPTRLTDATHFTATISAGSNAVYEWDFGDGQIGSGATTSHTYTSAGNYTAIVTATNTQGFVTANTSVNVTNSAPVANAGGNQNVSVNALVTLNGSASSDPDGHTPLQYQWTQTGGPAVILNDTSASTPNFTAPASPTVLTFTLGVTDSQGLADASPDEVVITVSDVAVSNVTAQNSSPTRLTDMTFFTVTASGSNVVFTWNFGDGSSTVNGANVNHTYAAAGLYTALVTATNNGGALSATTLVTVTNVAPIANAGADQNVNVGTTVQLNGNSSSDPDNHLPLSYLWAQTGGPAVTLSSNTAAAPTFTAPGAPTVLTFTLNVTDAQNLGSAVADEVVIHVGDAPIADLSAQSSSPTRLTDATLFTATTSAGSNVAYAWNFGDGAAVVNGVYATHTYTATGSYTAILTATNAAGIVSANTIVIVTNAAPVANAGADQSALVSATVTLDGSSSSDPDGHTPLAYHWTQTGGPSVSLSNVGASSPTFTAPASPAVLTFTLSVTDAQGLGSAAPDEVVITVNDVPVSGLGAQSSSPTRLTDATLFTATISAGSNVIYTWDFGDGTIVVNGATASHTYTATGSYTAIVTVTNAANSQSVNALVSVTNVAPVANAGVDQTVSISGNVTLNGLGSSDPDNHLPLSYLWAQTGGPAVTLSSNTAAAPTFTAPGAPAVITFTLLVTDSAGLPSVVQDEVVINVVDIGIAGLSAQSSSPTRLTDVTFFTASVSSGSGVSYVWDFGDGSATVAGVNATHTYTRTGSFIAVVTATNGIGNVTASTAVIVTNQAPVPNAGADQTVTVGANVALNGSGSDPDNHLPLSYGWQQIGGPSVTLSNNTTAAASFTAPNAPAVLTFTLSVTDAQGLANVAPDTVVITVTDVAVSGLSAASSAPTRLGNTTFFTASLGAGTNVSYQWNFGDGSPVVNGATVSHVYALAGNYTAVVTATNSAGGASASVTVAVTNQAPIANAGANLTVSIGGLVSLNGTASNDPDGHLPLSYKWTQTGGPAVTINNATSAIASFTAPNAPATLTFNLVVTDARGLASAPATVVFTVKDIGITGLTAQNSGPTPVGSATAFTATITAGSGVSYVWDFGDGSPTVAGANVSHIYAAAGSYTAIVTATNSNGSVSAQTVVTVNETKKFVYLPIVTRDAR